MDIDKQSQILKAIQRKADSISVLLGSLIHDEFNRLELIDGYEFILNVLRQLPIETVKKNQLRDICSKIFIGEIGNMINSMKSQQQQLQIEKKSEKKEEIVEKKEEIVEKNKIEKKTSKISTNTTQKKIKPVLF